MEYKISVDAMLDVVREHGDGPETERLLADLLAERDALAQRLARVEALRDSWLVEAAHDECRCGWCDGCTARAMALDLRAALGGEDA